MNRKDKIDFIKGILKGIRSPYELKKHRFAIAYQNPDTGQLSPFSPYAKQSEIDHNSRNAQLFKLSQLDKSVILIRVQYR